MADYDSGEITARERKAAERQKEIANFSDYTLTNTADWNKGSANNIESWNEANQRNLASKNAGNTSQIAQYNAGATRDQLNRQLANYDFANRQNQSLRDTQFKQASRKSEAERFEAQRNLQNAALGLFGTMNQAMNGSTVGNTMRMLENRNDADNSVYWQQLQDNRNAIQNAYDESVNQNNVAKRDAAINAIKALQDIQGDLSANLNNIQTDLWGNIGNLRSDLFTNISNIGGDLFANRSNLRADTAANLNNINPNLYEGPWGIGGMRWGGGQRSPFDSNLGNYIDASGYAIPSNMKDIFANVNSGIYKAPGSNATISGYQTEANNKLNAVGQNNATLLDYIMPANAEQNVRNRRNTLRGNDYYSQLINGFN